MQRTEAAAHRWRNVPVVRDHDHRGTAWVFALVAGILIAASPFIVYLLRQNSYVQVRYQIEELRSQHDRLLEAERRLRTERASLESLPRVEIRAQRELGLVRPESDRVVVVREVHAARAPVRASAGALPAAR